MAIDLLIGILGAALLLVGFFLDEIHILNRDHFLYNCINFIGAALLAFYAWQLQSIPFFVLNVTWTLVALRGMMVNQRS